MTISKSLDICKVTNQIIMIKTEDLVIDKVITLFREFGYTMRFGMQKAPRMRNPITGRLFTVPTDMKQFIAFQKRISPASKMTKRTTPAMRTSSIRDFFKQNQEWGTPQQQAVVTAIAEGFTHVEVQALAGTGKTATLVQATKRLVELSPELDICAVAFNKSVAEELKGRMPNTLHCTTAHALGFKMIKGRTLDNQKSNKILADILEKHRLSFDKKQRSDICAEVSRMKLSGEKPQIYSATEYNYETSNSDFAKLVLQNNNAGVFKKTCDFDDMIYLTHETPNPLFDVILVDEAQDLSKTRRALIMNHLKANGRIIYAGDNNQAIYEFTGAGNNCMEAFRRELGTHVQIMPLTKTFRCAKAVVQHTNALFNIGLIGASKTEGEVLTTTTSFKAGDLVICRRNEPLKNKAREMLLAGKPAVFAGGASVLLKYDPRHAKELEKWSQENQSESVLFMSIHKSKGLEADRVIILRPDLLENHGQERNLHYVAVTRAKKTLVYHGADLKKCEI